MTRTLPIMEARKLLTSLPEVLMRDGEIDVVEVTRRGKPVLAVMPWELYESITETLEVMADNDLMIELRQSIKEMEAGLAVSLEDVEKELTR